MPNLPLSLYIHLPWCAKKCPYCDFNSYSLNHQTLPDKDYLDALFFDLDRSAEGERRPLMSIFIGGGTPNLFSPQAIGNLLLKVARTFNLADHCEITMEANPGASSHHLWKEYQSAGVNRLSLGVQSFDDAFLRALQRIHHRQEAMESASAAARVFDRVNLDLMFGLPNQTLSDVSLMLDQVLSLPISHLSMYQLTLEPQTSFYAHPPKFLPDDDDLARMYEMIEDRLTGEGFHHYEVSAFARAGEACRHNMNYWQFGDYLGIGAGAHGKITRDRIITREARIKNPQRYIHAARARTSLIEETRVVTDDALGFEFMLNALRLTHGVPRSLFYERTLRDPMIFNEALNQAIARGLISNDPDRFVATHQGFQFLNETLQVFLATN
ncbi:MAG: radical SAM family heme chaperone HemW [Burkholderiales bacterium]|jgi:oxygen-independent coproporphyrinogen-3 oxidase|nr:radical SAM family heme chaperone HemW [Burkholderiales bacterium]